MAMPGKPAPLTKRSLMDLKGRINDDESGINLLRGLEVTLMTNWGPTKKVVLDEEGEPCLLYTSPSPRDISGSRMPSSA